MPDKPSSDDERPEDFWREAREPTEHYIPNVYDYAKAEWMARDLPKPEITDQIGLTFKEPDEEAKSDIHFGTGIHQAIEKHYTDMVQRETDGPDPLVQEPKGKP